MNHKFPFDREVAKEALRSGDTPALVLYAIVSAAYGDVLYEHAHDELDDGDGEIDPIELWLMIQRDFDTVVPEEVENKINAMRTAVETDAFYEDTDAFIAVIKAINEGDIDDIVTGTFEDLSAVEIIIAMFEIAAVRENVPPFAPSILAVIEQELAEEAEDTDSDQPMQVTIDQHKAEIQDWLQRLGVDPQVVQNF